MTKDDVLRLIEDGGKLTAIADLTGFPKGFVVQTARENGYGLNVSSDRFQQVAPAKAKPQGIVRAAESVERTEGCDLCGEIEHLAAAGETAENISTRLVMSLSALQMHARRHAHKRTNMLSAALGREQAAKAKAPESPAVPVSPVVRDLIAEGEASSVDRIRRAAGRARTAVDGLAALLDSARIEAERKAKAEAEKVAAAKRVADLKNQLAAAVKAQNAIKAPRKVIPGDSAAMRTWAAEAGVECPQFGIVPRRVVDAYLDAHQDGVA